MSPVQATPKGVAIARITLRRVAVPIENPRVFPVFEEMYQRARRGGAAHHPSTPGPGMVGAASRF